jgi:hypothetical protein
VLTLPSYWIGIGGLILNGGPFTVDDILDFLNRQSGILTLSSILVAIGIFFLQQHRDKVNKQKELNERLKRVCKTILTDIETIEEGFGPTKYPKIKKSEKGEDTVYTSVSVSTEIYHSLLNSGLFTYFEKKTQLGIGNLYYNIIVFNQTMRDMNITNKFFDLSRNRTLSRLEEEIKNILPRTKEQVIHELNKLD